MTKSYVVGIDPDSDKHGLALYEDGKLVLCETESTIDIVQNYLKMMLQEKANVLFAIEDVMSNQFVYARNTKTSKAAQSKVAMHIGRCQQSQIELMRWLEHYKVKYVLIKPQAGNWANNKAQFERITSYKKRTNADNRSAAFFGFLALNKGNKQ